MGLHPYNPVHHNTTCHDTLSSLVDFIESDFNLKEEFEKFEKAFERHEVVEL